MDGIFGIGPLELFFIAVIALIVLGPERLPSALREVASFIRKLRELANEFTSQFSDELKALDEINPQRIIRDMVDPTKPLPGDKATGSTSKTKAQTEKLAAAAATAQATSKAATEAANAAARAKAAARIRPPEKSAASTGEGSATAASNGEADEAATNSILPPEKKSPEKKGEETPLRPLAVNAATQATRSAPSNGNGAAHSSASSDANAQDGAASDGAGSDA